MCGPMLGLIGTSRTNLCDLCVSNVSLMIVKYEKYFYNTYIIDVWLTNNRLSGLMLGQSVIGSESTGKALDSAELLKTYC